MNNFRHLFTLIAFAGMTTTASAQFNDSGIAAGFFDSSGEKTINFSEFHLPPLAVLFENAKENPQILSLAKAQEIAEAEVTKQKKHIFSYVYGHASYSYGKADMWGNNSSTYNTMIYQFQGSEQNYWNVGVNISVPLEDVLDLGHSVKRKRLLVEDAQIKKDIAYDQLKIEIATLYTRITNNLVGLKTAGENAAIYQGAGALNLEDFHNGNMTIEDFAYTKLREESAVRRFQEMQTAITADILTLEILTHTPILTNSTTEITLDSTIHKSDKQMAREHKEVEKRIKKAVAEEQKRQDAIDKEEKKAAEQDAKQQKKDAKGKK